jgi:phage terminase large subunit-like protein
MADTMFTLLLLDDDSTTWVVKMSVVCLVKTGQLGVVYHDAQVYDTRETHTRRGKAFVIMTTTPLQGLCADTWSLEALSFDASKRSNITDSLQ